MKVSQSVFFGQLPKEYENVKEVSFGMRFAMCIFALLCVFTGLFPNVVTRYLTEPAANAVFNVTGYINSMMGSGYAESVMGESLPAAPDFPLFGGILPCDPLSRSHGRAPRRGG